jgi:uncharacterized protein (DUF433 family)
MSITLETLHVPLSTLSDGSLVITGTRLPLELLISDYQRGLTPQQLANHYSGLSLGDVYGVLAYYHQHREQVNHYVIQQEQRNERLHEKIHAAFPQEGLGKSIRERFAEKQK